MTCCIIMSLLATTLARYHVRRWSRLSLLGGYAATTRREKRRTRREKMLIGSRLNQFGCHGENTVLFTMTRDWLEDAALVIGVTTAVDCYHRRSDVGDVSWLIFYAHCYRKKTPDYTKLVAGILTLRLARGSTVREFLPPRRIITRR